MATFSKVGRELHQVERIEALADSVHSIALRTRPDGGLAPAEKGYRRRASSVDAVVGGFHATGAVGIMVPAGAVVVDADTRTDGGALGYSDVARLLGVIGVTPDWYRSRGLHNGAHLWYSREGFDSDRGHAWEAAGLRGDLIADNKPLWLRVGADPGILDVWERVATSESLAVLDWAAVGQRGGGGGSASLDHSPERQRLRAYRQRVVRHGLSLGRDMDVVEALAAGLSERKAAAAVGVGYQVVRTVKARGTSWGCLCGACRKLRGTALFAFARSGGVQGETGGEIQIAKKLEVKPKTDYAFPVAV